MAVAKRRHKSFTPKKQAVSLPLSFELYDEEFEAYPDLQGSVILEFAAEMGNEDGGSSARLILEFFDKALKPESLERFKALTHDPEKIIQAEELAEIVGWLMEEYTARDLKDASQQSTDS